MASPAHRRGAPALLLSLLLGITSVCLAPPLFGRVFSATPPGQGLLLWCAAGALLSLALLVALRRRVAPAAAVALALGITLVVDVELAFRGVALATFSPATLDRMASVDRALDQGRDGQAYRAHPFLHFKGSPEGGPFNALGFKGELPRYTKARGTLRVACMGGSTTEFGYPEQLQAFLEARRPGRFQVINFGISGWTSGHSLVNLALNVVDFDPDYLVIHHGWNDQLICQGPCSRGDYSHRFKPWRFRALSAPERLLNRVSYIYRALVLNRLHDWAEREPAAAAKSGETCPEDLCKKGGAFYHLRRNLVSMIHLAAGRHMIPVLATMPHSTRPPARDRYRLQLFQRANQVIRQVAAARPGQVLLVDLDQLMTGKVEARFTDLAHLDMEGRRAKAEAIGGAILAHREAQAARVRP